ncbi:bifunctional DNA primase/polymerase [uncultured Erythrobacter sp.]|uniref:bifunctional DNA primase/polymerase n=1 Tax=uncultured Erythrobacter sp. TaxID=263913 RepID=UPI00261464CE|nr:bifunctional DNA primase/polymerase [uncultured Erythrobacter sp.]
MSGLFSEWQPRYAEIGISTFPVRKKKPAVKGYLKLGAATSEQLALKFTNDNAFGFACKRNRLTILDVDTNDENVFADALAENGPTPVIVRSGSGNWQAWYRNNGEPRKVRPDPTKPIDILGDGFVVAPPSEGSKAPYEFVEGSLDDIANLPRRATGPHTSLVYNRDTPSLCLSPLPKGRVENPAERNETGKVGTRNNELWRTAMILARQSNSLEQLMAKTMETNRAFPEPLPAEEVLRIVASAWEYEARGENWVGSQGRATMAREEILAFPGSHTLRLYLLLKQSHRDPEKIFAISQSEVGAMLGIRQQHMSRYIGELMDQGYIKRVHTGRGKGDPHQYKFASKASPIG